VAAAEARDPAAARAPAEREEAVAEGERAAAEKERAAGERERAAGERERAAAERAEKGTVERETPAKEVRMGLPATRGAEAPVSRLPPKAAALVQRN
jgi:hypothetical protein